MSGVEGRGDAEAVEEERAQRSFEHVAEADGEPDDERGADGEVDDAGANEDRGREAGTEEEERGDGEAGRWPEERRVVLLVGERETDATADDVEHDEGGRSGEVGEDRGAPFGARARLHLGSHDAQSLRATRGSGAGEARARDESPR
ncbi:MAG: hypothetical protein H6720_00990 [Sandaracinus sp.]|nr:hypothetical protein [Sandaracinus sp.]